MNTLHDSTRNSLVHRSFGFRLHWAPNHSLIPMKPFDFPKKILRLFGWSNGALNLTCTGKLFQTYPNMMIQKNNWLLHVAAKLTGAPMKKKSAMIHHRPSMPINHGEDLIFLHPMGAIVWCSQHLPLAKNPFRPLLNPTPHIK